MHVYAQHGYGKSDYIEEGLRKGHIRGVVLSPRDEEPTTLATFSDGLRKRFGGKATILMDPQFYVTTVSAGREGNLPDYPYYSPSLTRATFNPTKVQDFARKVIDFQTRKLRVAKIVAPSVAFYDFSDPWSQISISLGQAAIDEVKALKRKEPLLVSLVFDEVALRNRTALEEFLDVITALDVHGFYVVVKPLDSDYPPSYEEDTLANLLYLCYTLADVNDFEVVCGYSDLVGVLLHAVGVTATATGWFTNLRQFSFKRFQPSEGGRQPRSRYTSYRLANSILVTPELQSIFTAKRVASVLSGTPYDGVFKNSPDSVNWTRKLSCLHHWEVLRRLAEMASSQRTTTGNLDAVEEHLRTAISEYDSLASVGVKFEAKSSKRNLVRWQSALGRFRSAVGV